MENELERLAREAAVVNQSRTAAASAQRSAAAEEQRSLLRQFVEAMNKRNVPVTAVYAEVSREVIPHFKGRIRREKIGDELRIHFRQLGNGWVLQQNLAVGHADDIDGLVVMTDGRLFVSSASRRSAHIVQTLWPDEMVWAEPDHLGYNAYSHAGVREDEFFHAGGVHDWTEAALPYWGNLKGLLINVLSRHQF